MFIHKRILVVINYPGDELILAGSIRKWVDDKCSVTIFITVKLDNDYEETVKQGTIAADVADLLGAKLIIGGELPAVVDKVDPEIIIAPDADEAYMPNGTCEEVLLSERLYDWGHRYEFNPNCYVDITDSISDKVTAYKKYGRKLDWRNWGDVARVEYAKAFQSIYRIG